MQKHTQQLVLMLVIGVLIGYSFTAYRNRQQSSDVRTTTETNATNTDAVLGAVTEQSSIKSALDFPLPPSVPANTRVGLTVDDQPSGKTVAVSGLSLQAKSWIAIYDGHNNVPGNILGAVRVAPTENHATVELLRPEGTTKGETYFAAILSDSGDDVFDRTSDTPAQGGTAVIVSWKAL